LALRGHDRRVPPRPQPPPHPFDRRGLDRRGRRHRRARDKRFVVGRADRFAERIAEQGAPILFKDPLTSAPGRELYVQHLGDDEKEGWLAIEAYAPGERELDCLLSWDRKTAEFVDPCTKARFPADGAGLTTYPGEVDDRTAVVIDLRTRSSSGSSG
jgi:hypothetical protein